MTATTRALGCAGLTPPERTMASMLLDVLGDQLGQQWRVVDSTDADVVLADPNTDPGRRALESASAGHPVIAVLDRDQTPGHAAPANARTWVYRPMRGESLRIALTSLDRDTEPVAAPETETAPEGQTLAAAIREAARGNASTVAFVVDDIEGGPMVIDPARDRMRGALDRLDAEHLADPTRYSVRATASPAPGVAPDAGERRMYAQLWANALADQTPTPLFGDPDATRVQLGRWPMPSAVGLTRAHRRALTLLRQRKATAGATARAAGLSREAAIALLNAAWLTGELEAVASEATAQPRAAPAQRRSVISRIRNKLGME